jgi:hypothetical protein
MKQRAAFISHAGSDRAAAEAVSRGLARANINVSLDATSVRPGTDFIAFMESALGTADYCCLLWSRAANESKWVRLEWTAALHRAVSESSTFLIVGRLEDLPVPTLLRPRLKVDLYPDIEPGIRDIVSMMTDDSGVAESTGHPVVKPHVPVDDDTCGDVVYITSKLFGKTFPMRIRLDTPALAAAERVVMMLGLPREAPGQHGVGLRFDYGLATQAGTLMGISSLAEQGVGAHSVLWLETSVAPFSSIEPVRRAPAGVTYRSGPSAGFGENVGREGIVQAPDALRSRIVALGLA